MSIIFAHWFEDESADITKGDLNQLEHENEKLREKAEKYDKLKEAIEKAKEEIEKTSKISFSKSHWSESSGLNMALDIIDKHLKEEENVTSETSND